MSHIYSLGAINKQTGEYVYPKIANKHDEYICPECNKDLILCQGEIRAHYFRHKVDTINPCNHYNNPSESQIHKDAKLLLKTLLEKRIPITFIRNCVCCKTNEEFDIPEITEASIIQLEYKFDYNGIKIADVAYIDNGEIICIFEICNTHKTCNENRPEPWFEINAETLINMVNDMNLTSLQIPCIRNEKCNECIICKRCNDSGYDKNGNCAICNINHKTKYEFVTNAESLSMINFPSTTVCILFDKDIIKKYTIENINNIVDINAINKYVYVNCEKNFSENEKKIIDNFNINNIEELIRNNKISQNDKKRCLECYNHVRNNYKFMGIEPFNGHNPIRLDKYIISIRILPDGKIKYCKSLGLDDFGIVGLK